MNHPLQSGRGRSTMWECCVFVIWLLSASTTPSLAGSGYDITESCYDRQGRPQRCIPEFGNAAFGLDVEATNTCGEDGIPTKYCIQTGARQFESCGECYPGDHPPSHMTDLNIHSNLTWWQSSTMYEGVTEVNLTLHFGKTYDITYVRIVFQSLRPYSFAIYKRIKDGDWVPYQFYSGDCDGVYQREDRKVAKPGEETSALCTSEFSDMVPTSGGNTAFSTLEGRPTDHGFVGSQSFQDWVSATDVRIVLTLMNTFGDEVFGGETVLKSYFYAISDIAVGARCKCNGHATSCNVTHDGVSKKVCNCEHHTTGDDCEKCEDFYQDIPWQYVTDSTEYITECRACNCNGFSTRCFFDLELYERTGHGGHCLDCTDNRDGPNCDRCRDNFYQDITSLACLQCRCNEIGSRSLQCNSEGKCDCKPGVTGDKCDRCAADYYEFSTTGCKECNCLAAGSFGNEPTCDQVHGSCVCKANVEGKECRRCKPGYFNLDRDNEFGCTPCFCYGHSSVCDTAPGYSRVAMESMFARNTERWSAETRLKKPVSVQYNSLTQVIQATATDREPVFFLAPEKFLGDQRAAYNQELEFKLRVGESGVGSVSDIILEGNGHQVYQTIFGQGNPQPSTNANVYKFRLHEDPDFGWEPRKSARELMSILSNITAIKIRGTYTRNGVGFLDDVKLSTARRGAAGTPAGWVETCSCQRGYVGQFCEECAPGFRHDPPNGGRFAVCVPCNCNGHADICDSESGRCICQHNTTGDNCERCGRGYYGNALIGSPHDCQLCPCPDQGACYQLSDSTVICLECPKGYADTPRCGRGYYGNALIGSPHDCQLCPCPDQGVCYQLSDSTVICLECPKGYAGARCDQCSDGFYGDVDGSSGAVRLCKPCDCNQNVDQNAVGTCDSVTGECLKCIYNTGGPHCNRCLPGFYGDALALPKEADICKPCHCDPLGTERSGEGPLACDQVTGQCRCKPNVTGVKCDQCQPGYYNLESAKGCESCGCNPVGSLNHTCDLTSGQCLCRPGVTGRQCDVCVEFFYGFSTTGCLPCECDQIGSQHLQCDPSGQCPCSENVEGRSCNRCKENKYDRKRNCVDCPVCYTLVQDSVNRHRDNLEKLEDLLADLIANPNIINTDEEFYRDLKEVQAKVEQLARDAKDFSGDDSKLTERIDEMRKKLEGLEDTLSKIDADTAETEKLVEKADRNTTLINDAIILALEEIQRAHDYILTDGATALAKARNRSIEFGQQNQQMSDIAHQARTTVEKQLEEAENTRKLAEMAVNISNEAHELSKEAREKQLNSSQALNSLSAELATTEQRLEVTEQLVNRTLAEVSDAYTDAFALAIEVNNLVIPEVNAALIKVEAQISETEAKKLGEEVEKLKIEFEKVTKGVDEKLNESSVQLEEGKRLQQTADELLADADAAKAKAQKAVELGDKILAVANETLESLQDFDHQVKESKKKAQEELQRIPNIQTLLQEAREKTTNAEEALAGAEVNAQTASSTAQSAQKQLAQQASTEANSIRQKAEDTKTKAGELRDEVGQLEDKILITGKKIDEVEERANEDIEFTDKAMEKVSQAQSKSEEASKQINKAMADLNAITRELTDLVDIDEDTLEQLEKKFNQAESEFINANLDEKLQILTNARLQQQTRLRSYEEELSRLEDEVDRVRRIKDSLPTGCWKRSRLEL